MTLRQADSFVDTLRTIVSLDGVSNITQKTYDLMSGFNGWMRRVAHISQEGCVKRLSNRSRRHRDSRKLIKIRSDKCTCKKCKRRTVKKFIDPDILANMAYELRVSQEKPAKKETAEEESEKPKMHQAVIDKKTDVHTRRRHKHRHHHHCHHNHRHQAHHRQDSRYLQQSDCVELAWWTKQNHQVYMPPLIQMLSPKPSWSECSSVSGFHSGSPKISDCIPSSVSSSSNSDYKPCRDDISPHYHINSKLDAKIPLTVTLRQKQVGRSASMPLGQKPRELQGLQMAPKRKCEKRRPVRSTSHTTNSFSNCIKCSRIVSRGLKRMTY